MLTELKSKESLPVIWEVFKQSKDLAEFWFSDHLTETFWVDFHHLMPDDISMFSEWLLDFKIYGYSKAPVVQAIEQLFYHQPDKQETILTFHKSLMENILQQQEAGTEVDKEIPI